ncbi:MAG: hypothetical protein EHM85_11915 [Desulfobacteraceae bacterium]|nr:MAG: hypothetical protein EHM85_11915 [Desulfobacteraceae bacterium]
MEMLPFARLSTIFQGKKWTEIYGSNIVFDKFCRLLDNLSEQQRNLILELTDRYTWMSYNEFIYRLIKVFNSIENDKLQALKRIVLFPVMKPEDEAVTKSGHAVLYLIQGIIPFLIGYKHITFGKIEEYDKITSNSFTISEDVAIFLIDDYLGSNETIKATIDKILTNSNIRRDNLYIISISAQKESLDFINSLGISVYTDHFSKKGISDYYSSPLLEENITIMLEIEKLITGNHFSFGYRNSEALITLIRTPDNTFPIFWKEYKKNGIKFEAPFARVQFNL